MLLLTKQLKGVREIIVSRKRKKNFRVVTEEWLKYKKNTVKKSTYYNYSYSVGKYLYPKFADQDITKICLLYTSPSPRDRQKSRMPSSA